MQEIVLDFTNSHVGAAMCDIADMANAPDEPLLYRQLMAAKPSGMTPNQWLVTAKVNRSFFSDLRRTGNARAATVQKLVEAIGMTLADFYAQEAPPVDVRSRRDETVSQTLPFNRQDEALDVPLLGTAMGADFEVADDGNHQFAEVTDLHLDEVIDHLRRPASLAGKNYIYALNIVGSSMSPRFDPGDPAYANPKQTPRIGDDVIVYLRRHEGEEERVFSVLIKRLVKRTNAIVELEQFNPPMRFTIAAQDVARIDRVIPWRELAAF